MCIITYQGCVRAERDQRRHHRSDCWSRSLRGPHHRGKSRREEKRAGRDVARRSADTSNTEVREWATEWTLINLPTIIYRAAGPCMRSAQHFPRLGAKRASWSENLTGRSHHARTTSGTCLTLSRRPESPTICTARGKRGFDVCYICSFTSPFVHVVITWSRGAYFQYCCFASRIYVLVLQMRNRLSSWWYLLTSHNRRWSKLNLNCMGNSTCGISGLTTHKIFAHPVVSLSYASDRSNQYRLILIYLFDIVQAVSIQAYIGGEVVKIARALGYTLPDPLFMGLSPDLLIKSYDGT